MVVLFHKNKNSTRLNLDFFKKELRGIDCFSCIYNGKDLAIPASVQARVVRKAIFVDMSLVTNTVNDMLLLPLAAVSGVDLGPVHEEMKKEFSELLTPE